MYEHIKILLVEDEAPLLGAMTLKLKKAGFTVLQGHNGREGLDIAMKELPNIIITDIVMPEMDGLQMIQNIRQDQQWGISVPIILLTNLNDFNHVATAMEYGVHDYLVKSNWKLKDLLETVKNKLNLSKEVTQASPEAIADPATVSQPQAVPTASVNPMPAVPQPAPVVPTPLPQQAAMNPVPVIPVQPTIPQPDQPINSTINPGIAPNPAPVASDPANPGTTNNYYS
jgi:CheY-like chemotaxis protein